MKKFLIGLTCLAIVPSSFGVPEYYSLSKSIRSLGMGGAFLGLSDDEYALFSNPAGLSLRRSGTEVMARLNGHVSKAALEGLSDFSKLSSSNIKTAINTLDKFKDKPLQANVGFLPYFVTKNIGVGILVADTKMAFNVTKSSAEIQAVIDQSIATANPGLLPATKVADLTFLSDSGIVVGYAQSVFDPNLHIGANLKGLFRAGGRKDFTAKDFQDQKKINFDPAEIGGAGLGLDLDLGATYELTDLPVGVVSRASVVLSNLLANQYQIKKTYAGAPGLVRTVNLGWYTAFEGIGFVDNFHVLADISDIPLGGEDDPNYGARTGSLLKKTHLGVEAPIGRLSVRAGLHQGYLTAGVGFNLYAARLDLATYGEETGENTKVQSRRYAFTAALGWGSAPPAPISATKAILEKPVEQKPMEQKPIETKPPVEQKQPVEQKLEEKKPGATEKTAPKIKG